MKEKDNRPFFAGGAILEEKNLIFVGGIVEGDSSIEKTGVRLLGQCRRDDYQRERKKHQDAESMERQVTSGRGNVSRDGRRAGVVG